MTDMPDYYRATNAAYETLIKFKAFSFPVNVFDIISHYNQTKLYTYAQIKQRFSKMTDKLPSDYGFTLFNTSKNKKIILYNSNKDYTTIRFTLAHELGHIVLNHMKDEDIENKEANCFARNLLCPVPVIEEMNINSVNEYQEFFNVSVPMAELSKQYLKSDKYYITEKNYLKLNSEVFHKVTGYFPEQFYNLSYSGGF